MHDTLHHLVSSTGAVDAVQEAAFGRTVAFINATMSHAEAVHYCTCRSGSLLGHPEPAGADMAAFQEVQGTCTLA